MDGALRTPTSPHDAQPGELIDEMQTLPSIFTVDFTIDFAIDLTDDFEM
jgi:hypothetical protein